MDRKFDVRETDILFKPNQFYNCFGIFAIYDYAELIKDSMGSHAIQLIKKAKKINASISIFEAYIEKAKVIQSEDAGEQLLENAIEELNLNNNPHIINIELKLNNKDTLTMLENLKKESEDNLKSLLNKIYVLNAMILKMYDELDKGIVDCDTKTEIEKVTDIIHKKLDYDNMSDDLSSARKVSIREEFYDELLEEVLSTDTDSNNYYAFELSYN